MNIKDKRGSITIFVLFGLLFMSAYLMISYANNLNKSKFAKEQFSFINSIYSHGDGIANSYTRFITSIRKKNKDILTASVEGKEELQLKRTYKGTLSNYRIYGNTAGVGKHDTTGINGNNYKFQVIVSNGDEQSETVDIWLPRPLKKDGTKVDYIDYKEGVAVYVVGVEEEERIYKGFNPIPTYEDITNIQIRSNNNPPSKIEVEYTGYTIK